jgi:hypothetical protein
MSSGRNGFACPAIDRPWVCIALSDFESGMGTANLAQVRTTEVTAPRTRPLNCV